MFERIPLELRQRRQWIVWRLEARPGTKPTKVPYVPRPGCGKASVTDPNTWGTYEEACAAPLTCVEPVPWDANKDDGHGGKGAPTLSVEQTGFSGIGFVLTAEDPYAFIDLDDTHGDNEAFQRQLKVFTEFNSYSELSPSGNGMHIIIKGSIPHGRRRAAIEVYSSERYMTMTGNVQRDVPIAERQQLFELLFDQMGGPANSYVIGVDQEQTQSDEEIIAMAAAAVNGDKFSKLFRGEISEWYGPQHGHQGEGRSEADFALVDIIAFYTQNKAQIARIFLMSELARRDKYQSRHGPKLIEYMTEKSFDRQLPPIDIEGLRVAFDNLMKRQGGGPGEPGGTPDPRATMSSGSLDAGAGTSHAFQPPVNPFPPGLLGAVASFIYEQSPRPAPAVALAGAVAFMSGICGRAYNVSGTGLNQYVLLLAQTGIGKDTVAHGASKLFAAIQSSVPSVQDFKGPGELVSSAGIIKWLDKKPCVLSVLGEFGKKMKEMAAPNANAHLHGVSRILLQLYTKSGAGQVLDPMAYSDVQKNTNPIQSPSLTIFCESVPESFYDGLDETLIADGLLPRFLIFEYKGERCYLKEGTEHILPPFALVQQLADLAAACLTLAHNRNVHNVGLDQEAAEKFREFDRWTTDQINMARNDVHRQLWNRAHLKAMKLAAIWAVGVNYLNPLIDMAATMWATNLVVEQTLKLIAKFETGQVGAVGGSEAKQLGEVIKAIATYLASDWSRYGRYGGTWEMHRDGVITEAHISRRLMAMACFRQDRMGSTSALKRALKVLLEADELREVPKAQMQQKYGTGPRAFVVANPARFVITEE
jgi:hypothetical protein